MFWNIIFLDLFFFNMDNFNKMLFALLVYQWFITPRGSSAYLSKSFS